MDEGWVLVTPTLAAEWLEGSTYNRVLSRSKVTKYSRDMVAGQWRRTGEAIAFDTRGELRQGHHRCLACIQAGVPFETRVLRGIDDEAFLVADSGKPWTFADHLSAKGERDYRGLASTVMWIYRYENGDLNAIQLTPSVPILMERLERSPEIRDSLTVGRRIRRAIALTQPVASGSYFVARSIDETDAEGFFGALESGENLNPGSPILALRNWLAVSRARTNFRAQQRIISATTIKAWNAFREGEEVTRLLWRRGGSNPEIFPHMI